MTLEEVRNLKSGLKRGKKHRQQDNHRHPGSTHRLHGLSGRRHPDIGVLEVNSYKGADLCSFVQKF